MGGPLVIGTAQDVTDRRRAEQDFAHQAMRLRLLLGSIKEGVLVADADGQVVEANPAAVAMLGLARPPRPTDPLKPGAVAAFLPDTVTPFPPARLPLLVAVGGEAVDNVLIYVKPAGLGGKGLWLSVTGRPLVNRDGTRAGGVIVFTEVGGPPAALGDPHGPSERTDDAG